MTQCDCSDPGCEHVDIGLPVECPEPATMVLARIDMEGANLLMCELCADDALATGVFEYIREFGS